MKSRVVFASNSDEWETPQSLFDALDAEFRFVVDAAATSQNAKCPTFFGNALNGPWDIAAGHSVWLNLPYSQCRAFMAKAATEAAAHGCTVVCLVPSRTDTRWWHEHVWDTAQHRPRAGVEVRFLRGRLKFGSSTAGAPFPSVIVVFRGGRHV